MKRTITLLGAVLLAMGINAQVEPTDTDSNGSRNVSTLEHLRWISENSSSWSSSFELDNDIDASATSSWNYYADIVGFKPIGLGYLDDFEGEFDGKGYTISNLHINSSVTGLQVGLFSTTDNATIENLSLADANVVSDAGAGILIGKSDNTTINNCSVTGTVSGDEKIGGMIGRASTTAINNCSASVNIPNIHNIVGGLVGELKSSSSINNSNSSGTISGNNNVGGLVGSSSSCVINNSFSSVNVSSDSHYVGGFVGNSYQSTIENSYSTGSVNVTGQAASNSGGFVGQNSLGTISLCHALGSLNSEDTEVGGFVGYNTGTIDKCYAFVNTVGYATVGGFAGDNNTSTGIISNCYSRGAVTATGTGHVYVGGFIGNNTYQGQVINSYSTGFVSAPNTSFIDIGGFVGDNSNSAPQAYQGVVTDCYWDNNTSGMSTSAAGTGESTSNMKSQSTFMNWNFTNIWSLDPYFNDGYPRLDLFTVGVEEKEDSFVFNVYPNPFQNSINFSIKEGEVSKVQIIDLSGKIILQIEETNTSAIDVSALKSGVYFIIINDYKLTKKIIKQ